MSERHYLPHRKMFASAMITYHVVQIKPSTTPPHPPTPTLSRLTWCNRITNEPILYFEHD